MSFEVMQFEELIRDALEPLSGVIPVSDSAVFLLLGTAAQESHLGKYVRQINGPALGVFQMEPATHNDIWEHFITNRASLTHALSMLGYLGPETEGTHDRLIFDLRYAAIMARIHYYRVPEALPPRHGIPGLAAYWKEHYNTHLGRGTVAEFEENFNRYVLSEER